MNQSAEMVKIAAKALEDKKDLNDCRFFCDRKRN